MDTRLILDCALLLGLGALIGAVGLAAKLIGRALTALVIVWVLDSQSKK
jgi:hypothetical protein